jgi:leucyl/phenylalanyl-tRNA--protein transferase
MLAQQRAIRAPMPPAVPATAGSEKTRAVSSLPQHESPPAATLRWVLGTAYALQPQRIASLPALLLWTGLDLLRGGTRLPDPARTRSTPDTFGGVVRELSPETYLAAARIGFFPWAHCGPLKWWTRKERAVLFLPERHISRRVKRMRAAGKYRVTFDTAFDDVLLHCGAPRAYNWHTLTWLTPRMMQLFSALHRQGHAHSFEVWNADGTLVGGGFGVAVGRIFIGESMFSRETDASKLAAAVLYDHLEAWGFALVDARDTTPVLERMGYRRIPRTAYEQALKQHADAPGRVGPWTADPLGSP